MHTQHRKHTHTSTHLVRLPQKLEALVRLCVSRVLVGMVPTCQHIVRLLDLLWLCIVGHLRGQIARKPFLAYTLGPDQNYTQYTLGGSSR
jgi:adenylate cyclase